MIGVVEPVEAGLPLPDDLGVETAGPIPRHRQIDRTDIGQQRFRGRAVAAVPRATAGRVVFFIASLGASVYDPNDAVGRLLFNVLAMVAEFESDLIRLRTREGMKVAKAKGRLRGKQPKLNPRQEAHLVALLESGEHTTAELADLFGVGRSTVYRAEQRHLAATRG